MSRWDEIERIGKQRQPSDPAYASFAHAAAAACLFELKVRLFADNTTELQRFKDEKLEGLVKRLVEHAAPTLQEEEVVHLKKCARLRNKLLHADFSKAAGTLLSIGVELRQGTVYLVDLQDGSVRRVSETTTTDGRVSGWVLEGKSSGAFDAARMFFVRGIDVITWLLATASGVEM
ncbi:MAG: hypothetical protein KGL39_45440 [Patescibacteria group bacterium]|nr:hypothetical protein [Patescibacteria group bacterium]